MFNKHNSKEQDLGFGGKITQKSVRLINKDGSFNIVRKGKVSWDSYQYLIGMHNWQFLLFALGFFIAINILFALGFFAIGVENLNGVPVGNWVSNFLYAFFFSVQSFTTVGYGAINPESIAANLLACICALVGLLSAALTTGLFFARFVSPRSHILFSKMALLTSFQGVQSFQCRLVNSRSHRIVNLSAQITMSWLEEDEFKVMRRQFATLPIERPSIMLFPLNWTLVHIIDETSPMYHKNLPKLKKMDTEFLITIVGFDESYNQQIHINTSYSTQEILENVKFKTMYSSNSQNNATELDLDAIDEVIEV